MHSRLISATDFDPPVVHRGYRKMVRAWCNAPQGHRICGPGPQVPGGETLARHPPYKKVWRHHPTPQHLRFKEETNCGLDHENREVNSIVWVMGRFLL
jgi:hypothetical protein